MWLMIARIVATLDIKKVVVDGVPVDPQPSYDNAFLRSVFSEPAICIFYFLTPGFPGFRVISNVIFALEPMFQWTSFRESYLLYMY